MGSISNIALVSLVSLTFFSQAMAQTSSDNRTMPLQLAPPTAADLRTKLLEWRQLYELFKEREATLSDARRPAGSDDLARLETARAVAAPRETKDFIVQSLDWYADRLPKSELTQPLELPQGKVILDVMMVRFETQFTPRRPDGTTGIQRQPGEVGLQVAWIDAAQKSILWLPDLGFVLVPRDYISAFLKGNSGAKPAVPLEIGK